MKIVAVDMEKVCVPTLKDANQLMQALIRYNCEGTIQKYDSFGENDKPADYTILFDDFEINVINKVNAETIIDWLLTLHVTDIFIRKVEKKVEQVEQVKQPEQTEQVPS